MKYYLALKEKEVMPFAATWMDLEIIWLSEESQRVKDKLWYLLDVKCEKLYK